MEQGVVKKVQTEKNTGSSSLTPEFKVWLDEVGKKHASLIKELAKK